jgi:uncharacterized protein YdeI (YjbR/CyaY-like superfamily)
MRSKTFQSTLERSTGKGMNWVIARLPFSVEKVWETRGHLKVIVQVNGFEFRTAILPTRRGEHFLIVNKKTQQAARITAGDAATFNMMPDPTAHELRMPAELKDALKEDRLLKKFFDNLSPWLQRALADSVNDSRSGDVRRRRSTQLAERLLQTMDAEQDLPPLLRMTLRRHRGAEDAWARLTAVQRRQHLLVIFGCRTPAAQVKRLEKMIEAVFMKDTE